MPVSIPVMWLVNGVRTKASSFQQAQRLSTIWWGRVVAYTMFGLGLFSIQPDQMPKIMAENQSMYELI